MGRNSLAVHACLVVFGVTVAFLDEPPHPLIILGQVDLGMAVYFRAKKLTLYWTL